MPIDLGDHRLVAAKATLELNRRVRRQDPATWAKDRFGLELWKKQQEIALSVRHNRKTLVKACHASGKTMDAAAITMWFLDLFKEVIVITTAPTWTQVEKLLWGEIHYLVGKSRLPYPEPTKTELRLGPKRYAYGLSTSVTKQDEGVKFQGFHAPVILVIFDEGPGVDPKIWEAAAGILSSGDAHFLGIGNPTMGSGPFYDGFSSKTELYKTFTISAFDTPNFVGLKYTVADKDGKVTQVYGDPNGREFSTLSQEELQDNPVNFLISKMWVAEQLLEWGFDHPFVQSRVFGEFPQQDEHSLFWLTWLDRALHQEPPVIEGDGPRLKAGIDVAGPGEAETVLHIARGPEIIFSDWTVQPDPRGWLVERLNRYRTPSIEDKHLGLGQVNVDSCGIGWGVVCHLRDEKFPVKAVNVGETPRDKDKYANLKAELFWGLRKRFQDGDVCGLKDERTRGQLATIRYEHNSRGQLVIESKEDMVKRGVKSPDRAEALMLTFGHTSQSVWERL
jgi:phage terminase large subunit